MHATERNAVISRRRWIGALPWLAGAGAIGQTAAQGPGSRPPDSSLPRVLVSTDVGGADPDDFQSLVVRGQARSASAEYVTGEYVRGLGVSPAAGRLIEPQDDRPGAAPVAVISFAASQQRFGGPSDAIGEEVLVDNVPFTVAGVATPEFFGVDPAAAPDIYLPMHTTVLVDGAEAQGMFSDNNYYWMEVMGRLRPGVSMAQAQAALAPRFHQWVEATATT